MKKLILLLAIVVLIAFSGNCIAEDEVQDTYIAEEYQQYCVEIGEMYGVAPELLMAMIESESSGKPNVSNGSCVGLMQVSERWHKDRMEKLGVTDLYDPYSNILVGTDYLMELADKHCDVAVVLMYYNGDSKADDFERGECEMSYYARKILKRSNDLTIIHDKEREEIQNMKKDIVHIERASESLIEQLLKLGFIYIGEDNQLHVTERRNKEGE